MFSSFSSHHGGKGWKGKAEEIPHERLERLLTRILRYGKNNVMLSDTERIDVTGTCGLYSMAYLVSVEPQFNQFSYEELHEMIAGAQRRLDTGETTGRFMMMVSVGVVNVGLTLASEADHCLHGFTRAASSRHAPPMIRQAH